MAIFWELIELHGEIENSWMKTNGADYYAINLIPEM